MEEFFDSLGRFNFWDGHVPSVGFRRDFYLDRIKHYINNKLVKVIVGQRRTGKSYILRQIAQYLIAQGVDAKQILYINIEYIAFDFLQRYQDLDALIQFYHARIQPKGKIYLLIDDIQHIIGWEKLVNSYAQDFSASYELFITGSNSNMLSGELASLLSGRYVQFEILPFSFTEYVGIHKVEANKANYALFLQTGGLPELFAFPTEETKRHYVSSVKDTVLLRDIIQKNAIKDPKLLEDIFIYLINNAANLLSVNNITNYLKSSGRNTTFDTVSNYIGYIQETYLIHKAERFDIKGKETIAGNAKYYANDLCYKNYLYSGFGYGVGYLLENLVYLALCRTGYKVYVGVLPNKEVDFVAQLANETLYVQSAYLLQDETTVEREFAALASIADNHPKLVVSMDDIALPSRNGIHHVQAWNLESFLMG